MLQTNKSWESESRGKLLSTLYNESGLRYYPCVEIPVNVRLFHLDVVMLEKKLNAQPWSRFIFDELAYVLRFIARNDVSVVRISLQSRRYENDEYTIRSIVEILEGKDKNGRKAYLYKCSKNISHIEAHMAESEGDLSEKRTIWQRIV